MQAATETITLGTLAMRLAGRIDWVSVTTLGKKNPSESAFGRDTAALIKRYYSAKMEWNQLNDEEGVWQTVQIHKHRGKHVAIQLRVFGGGRD